MAEVLAVMGIIANIVQIVDFGERVISRLNDFHRTVNNCPRAFRQTMTEVPLLVDTLKQTEKGIAAGTVQEDTARALFPVVEGCREQLETLDSLLKKALPKKGDSMGTRNLKALSSLIQEPKVEKLNRSIHRYIQTLTFYHAAAASTAYPSVGEKLAKLRRWLSAPDPSPTQYKLVNERLANTGLWFLKSQKYTRWKTDIMSFLWLYGIPGSGKSVLCSGIVEDVSRDCESDAGKAIAYYYFSFSSLDDQAPEQMIKSLISQFSEKCVKVPASLESVLSSDPTGQRHPPLHKLLEILREILEGFPASYIVLDALDESRDRERLLDIITKIARWEVENLHMIVLSRDEPEIRHAIENIANETDIIGLQSKVVDEDIRHYVRYRLAHDKKLKRWQNQRDVQEEIEKNVMEKAGGMFRWASCQLDMLAKSLNRLGLRQNLKNLPKTLGDTYERILSTIDDDYRDYALTILRWLAFSTRPLYADEVAEIVAITADDCPTLDRDQVLEDPFDVLTICSSLVTVIGIPAVGPVPKELAEKGIAYERPAFTLAHYSVKEYLLSEAIQKSTITKFSIQEAASQAFIAKCCLGYVLQFRQRTSLSQEVLDDFKLAEYAAQFWPYHVRAAGDQAESVHHLVMELLSLRDNAYLNWFRLFDIDTGMMNLNSESKQLPEPLYSASAVGLTNIVRLLIAENSFDINRRSGIYGTALQAASFHGYNETVDLLLDMGADPNIQSEYAPSALQVASAVGHLEVVEKLLRAGADSNLQSEKYGTALQAASVNGHMAIVERLIANGADVNVQGGEYGTALMGALVAGHHAIVNQLLEAGADIHLEGGIYNNTLQAASFVGENELIRKLLKTGADVNKQGGRYGTALQAAAFNGHYRTVELLLEAGADVNLEGGEYGYALQAASANNHGKIVNVLLDAGADVNAQGGRRFTALLAAIAEEGNMGIIERLLEAGADINIQTYTGNALHTAVRVGRKDVVDRLLKEGADINAHCEDAGSVLLVAMWYGRRDIAELLLKMGADINAIGRHGSVRQLAAVDGYSLKSLQEI